MKILVVNCGSSSLKYQLIDSESEKVFAAGQCERIGLDGVFIIKIDGNKEEKQVDISDHAVALKVVLDELLSPERHILSSLDEIHAVGHRVVHGGEKFSESVLITEEVIQEIEECSDLAPLHNPANILGIRACQKLMPGVPNVAVFDTAYHQTMPPKAYLYGIPKKYYEQYGIRRYGFHGTSHSYVSERLAQLQGLDYHHSKLIVCHIGSGASVCAIKDGKSVDTSMGMTPLEGLVMGTRSGDLDPAIIEYICNKEGKSVSEVLMMLNKEAGVLGISGITNDYRDLLGYEAEHKYAKYALEVLVYRISKYVGAYFMAMGGVDAIALTAGAGENNLIVRGRIVNSFAALGVKFNDADERVRTVPGEEMVLSTPDSKIPVWTIPTNEELKIARETAQVVGE